MSEKGYQGYTNYETWNVALHIGNDYGLYRYSQEQAASIKDTIENGDCARVEDGTWTEEQAARYLLADALEGTFKAHPLADTTSMYSDLLTNALGRVDWHEVADSVLEV